MTDTTLQLEAFVFADLEIPERIPWGGEQQTATHELIGGIRVIDALGRADRDLEWSGHFLGTDATDRALYIDGLRIAGKPVPLSWGEFSYTVLVKAFRCDYEAFYRLPYTITCQVVADNTTQVTQVPAQTTDDAVQQDLGTANTLSPMIADPTLINLMGALTLAIGAVATFVHAPRSIVNSVLGPLGAVTARVGTLIDANDATIGSAQGFAGIVPGDDTGSSLAAFGAQQSATTNLVNLLQLRAVCGRMGNNLGAVGASEISVTTAGGDLFQIAAQQYGDAMGWTGIAKANDLTDPFVDGVQTLAIPPQADTQDGVLTQ